MTRWSKEFRDTELLAKSVEIQKRLKLSSFKTYTAPYSNEIIRIKKFIKLTVNLLKKIDPSLVPLSAVAPLKPQLDSILSNINAYVSDKNIAYLKNANTNVDQALMHLQQLAFSSIENPTISAASLSSLDDIVSDSVTQMVKKKNEFSNQIGSLKAQITAQEKHLKTIQSEGNQQIKSMESALSDIRKEFNVSQAERRKTFTSTQQEKNGKFITFQASRNKEHSSWFKNLKKNTNSEKDGLINSISAELGNKKSSVFVELDNYVSASKENHDKILNLLGLTSSDMMRGEAKKVSDKELENYKTWRKFSFGSLVALAIIITIASFSNGVSPTTSLTVAPISLLLLSVAAYAGRLAAGHRREALRLRQFNIEMEAIVPYLEALDNSENKASKDLRNKLAEKFFGNLPPVEANQHKSEIQLTDGALQKISEHIGKDLPKAIESFWKSKGG